MPWKIILGSGLKRKVFDDSALSEWVKVGRHLVKRCVYFVRISMSTRSKSVFENKEIAAKLANIHDTYVVVPNNVAFVFKNKNISNV